ncbi:MAG: entericidin [Gammaproteobacteria bacterium]|mgnify:FL=1|jgi:predicted small secreted protein|nr:entericidin [Gammaproteobacteria bacterium]|tara:strand:- start:1049 stop:1183 length:135 start_codon:yes stop_codon:yes gene_type:complete
MKNIMYYGIIFMGFTLLIGCNTVDGVGRDISAAAEWVSGTVNEE